MLRQIITSTQKYNFHSHTQFCDGRATIAEMAEAVANAGFTHWGFTPHSTVPMPTSCNMLAENVPAYLAEVDRVKKLYHGHVNFYTSMEIDYLGDKWGATNPYFDSLPLDYRLSSVHFVPSLVTGEEIDIDGRPEAFFVKMKEHFDNDIRYVVDKFYERSKEMLQAGGFDILGHFDKIGFNASQYQPGIEDEPWYHRHIDEMTDLILSSDVITEINTKALNQNNRLFPSPRFSQRLIDARVPLMVNSDAHYPDRINAGRDEAFSLLEKHGYRIPQP